MPSWRSNAERDDFESASGRRAVFFEAVRIMYETAVKHGAQPGGLFTCWIRRSLQDDASMMPSQHGLIDATSEQGMVEDSLWLQRSPGVWRGAGRRAPMSSKISDLDMAHRHHHFQAVRRRTVCRSEQTIMIDDPFYDIVLRKPLADVVSRKRDKSFSGRTVINAAGFNPLVGSSTKATAIAGIIDAEDHHVPARRADRGRPAPIPLWVELFQLLAVLTHVPSMRRYKVCININHASNSAYSRSYFRTTITSSGRFGEVNQRNKSCRFTGTIERSDNITTISYNLSFDYQNEAATALTMTLTCSLPRYQSTSHRGQSAYLTNLPNEISSI